MPCRYCLGKLYDTAAKARVTWPYFADVILPCIPWHTYTLRNLPRFELEEVVAILKDYISAIWAGS